MHARSLLGAALLMVAGCTDDGGGGGGGGGGTSHVATIEFMAPDTGACIDGELADVDSDTPGAQYDCAASDLRGFGTASQTETALPACNNTSAPAMATNKPCWAIVADSAACPMTPHLRVTIERTEAADADTLVRVQCVALEP